MRCRVKVEGHGSAHILKANDMPVLAAAGAVVVLQQIDACIKRPCRAFNGGAGGERERCVFTCQCCHFIPPSYGLELDELELDELEELELEELDDAEESLDELDELEELLELEELSELLDDPLEELEELLELDELEELDSLLYVLLLLLASSAVVAMIVTL